MTYEVKKQKRPVFLTEGQISWLSKNIPGATKEPKEIKKTIKRESILVNIDESLIKAINIKANLEKSTIDLIVEKYLTLGLNMNHKDEILETYKHAENLILEICKKSPETAASYIATFNKDRLSYLKYLIQVLDIFQL